MKYIFLHGMGQTSADWDDALSAAGHTDDILVPDLKAFIGNDSYADMFKNFTEYCDAFPDKFCLCGLSLAGMLPRGESCIIRGCGHEVNTEKSGLTGRIIAKRFFKGGDHR